jgi:hypothetical protein
MSQGLRVLVLIVSSEHHIVGTQGKDMWRRCGRRKIITAVGSNPGGVPPRIRRILEILPALTRFAR